jgi:hypothetical protein
MVSVLKIYNKRHFYDQLDHRYSSLLEKHKVKNY